MNSERVVRSLDTWAFALLATGLVFLCALPLALEVQQTLAGILLAAMLVLKVFAHNRIAHSVFLTISVVLTLRYIFWRGQGTLPPIDDVASFAVGMLLFVAEVYAVLVHFLGIFICFAPIRRPTPPLPARLDEFPSVDVFIPSYNEDPEILENTLVAARKMRYPAGKLAVYLLDDGGTDEKVGHSDPVKAAAAQERRATLQQLCADTGCVYLTRARNLKAKAGNLSAAFTVTDGDLIAVFDADHTPTADFLEQTVGHFLEDPKLFLVQTPHFFIAPDPLERNLNTFSQMPSENEMFYSVVQLGLDRWNASFFCGSAALLRRSCLAEVGGFHGETVTEDCETALTLHAKGFNSRYVNKPMIAGLQPETFTTFIGQRSRWARGMTQLFMLQNPLFKPGLTLPQRLCYISSMIFWFFSYARILFMLAPLAFLIFDLRIFRANGEQFLTYALPYIVSILVTSRLLYGRVRWPLVSELYEYIQSVFLIRVISRVVLRPRHGHFNVTDKALTHEKDHLSPLAGPFLLTFLLLLLGVVSSVRLAEQSPDQYTIFLVVSLWNLFNLIIAMAALGVVCEGRQVRKAPRIQVASGARLTVGDRVATAVINDASMSGVQFEIVDAGWEGVDFRDKPVALSVTEEAADGQGAADLSVLLDVRRVQRKDGRIAFGARFITGTATAREAIIGIVYAHSHKWESFQAVRRSDPGTVRGIAIFSVLAIRYAVFAVHFAVRSLRTREASRPAAGGGRRTDAVGEEAARP